MVWDVVRDRHPSRQVLVECVPTSCISVQGEAIRLKTALFAILFALTYAMAAQADIKAGELYGYRIGNLFELAEATDRREYPSTEFPFLSVEARALDAPKFVEHVWLELTPLTYEIMGIRTVIPVKDEVEGRALVDPYWLLITEMFPEEDGWRHEKSGLTHFLIPKEKGGSKKRSGLKITFGNDSGSWSVEVALIGQNYASKWLPLASSQFSEMRSWSDDHKDMKKGL